MSVKSFNEAVLEFRATAKENRVPESMVEQIVTLYTAPVSDGQAAATALRWFNAPISDPIHRLTIKDIADMFGKAKVDWENSSKVADQVWTDVTDPSKLEKAADASRKFDWAGSRARIAEQFDRTKPLSGRCLATIDNFVDLAKKGLVREALTGAIRLRAEAVRNNAMAYANLTQSGAAGLTKGKNWDDYYDGLGDGFAATAGLAGVFWCAGGPATAGVGFAIIAGIGIGNIIRRHIY